MTYTKTTSIITRENSEWERRVAVESERRQTPETYHPAAANRQWKLEKHIGEWKLIADGSKSNADKYCSEMSKIFTALDQVKSELACNSTKEYLG